MFAFAFAFAVLELLKYLGAVAVAVVAAGCGHCRSGDPRTDETVVSFHEMTTTKGGWRTSFVFVMLATMMTKSRIEYWKGLLLLVLLVLLVLLLFFVPWL